ncbi:MAG: GNAT family N-acetyltransferase [Bacteriovorax sp.]|nr:GNAT family N-acetyltransferase [Bacteriovorax sp.]
MEINSLAFQTDLYFHRFTGIVLEYDNFLVVKNPRNPTFFWGNLLYFKDPPDQLALNNWTDLFKKEFQDMDVQHMTFAWDALDGEEGSAIHFVENGFNLEKSLVMMADDIYRPAKINEKFNIRVIESEQDWNQVIDNHVACRAPHFNKYSYRKFSSKRIADYRSMVNSTCGVWMGAFLDDKLVGDLGLFYENGVGRFQVVGTHPDFRRMGVCSTLLYKSCLYGQKYFNISKFIIVADPDYHAANIYQSIGFSTREIQIGLCKFNKEVWVT